MFYNAWCTRQTYFMLRCITHGRASLRCNKMQVHSSEGHVEHLQKLIEVMHTLVLPINTKPFLHPWQSNTTIRGKTPTVLSIEKIGWLKITSTTRRKPDCRIYSLVGFTQDSQLSSEAKCRFWWSTVESTTSLHGYASAVAFYGVIRTILMKQTVCEEEKEQFSSQLLSKNTMRNSNTWASLFQNKKNDNHRHLWSLPTRNHSCCFI